MKIGCDLAVGAAILPGALALCIFDPPCAGSDGIYEAESKAG